MHNGGQDGKTSYGQQTVIELPVTSYELSGSQVYYELPVKERINELPQPHSDPNI